MSPLEKQPIKRIKEGILKEKKIISELENLFENSEKAKSKEEKEMIGSEIDSLKKSLVKKTQEITSELNKINLAKKFETEKKPELPEIGLNKEQKHKHKKLKKPKIHEGKRNQKPIKKKYKKIKLSEFEKDSLGKIRNKEKKKKRKKEESKTYTLIASKMFSKPSRNILRKKSFRKIKDDLLEANFSIHPIG